MTELGKPIKVWFEEELPGYCIGCDDLDWDEEDEIFICSAECDNDNEISEEIRKSQN